MSCADNPDIQNILLDLFAASSQFFSSTRAPPLQNVAPPRALEVEIEGSSTDVSTTPNSTFHLDMPDSSPMKKTEKKERKKRRRLSKEEPTLEWIDEENKFWGQRGEEARKLLGDARDKHNETKAACELEKQMEEERNGKAMEEIWDLEEYLLNLKPTSRAVTPVPTAPSVPEHRVAVTVPPSSEASSSTGLKTLDNSTIDTWIHKELDEIRIPLGTTPPMPAISTSSTPPEAVGTRKLMRFEEVFWEGWVKLHVEMIERCPEAALFPECFFNPYHPNKLEMTQIVEELPSALELHNILEGSTGRQPDKKTLKVYEEMYKRLHDQQKKQSRVIQVEKRSKAKRARFE